MDDFTESEGRKRYEISHTRHQYPFCVTKTLFAEIIRCKNLQVLFCLLDMQTLLIFRK
jgi:ribosomal protein S26